MGVDLAVGVLFGLIDRAMQVTSLIRQGKAEKWTPEQWKVKLDALAAQDDVARAALVAAIAKAKAGG